MTTVKELIEQLSELEQDAKIYIDEDEVIKIFTMRCLCPCGSKSYMLYSEEPEEED